MKKAKFIIAALSLVLVISLSFNYVLYNKASTYKKQLYSIDQEFITRIASLMDGLDSFQSEYASGSSSENINRMNIEHYQDYFSIMMDKAYNFFPHTSYYNRNSDVNDCLYYLYNFFTYNKNITVKQSEDIRHYLKEMIISKNDYDTFSDQCKNLLEYLKNQSF